MPIKIHHGPPGSFKTAGAMADDFLREARAGRTIVTNCRGVSRDRCIEEFPDLPPEFDVIHVDDQTKEGREKWATWFHWVPKGAFVFVDEVQDIWPRKWRQSDIDALDYPGGIAQATADDRPYNWDQAWDKHRHWNWDIVCTTPQYKKVRDDIKGVADAAYKHKDLALVGWTGRYIEAMHLADDSGSAASDFLNVERKKVPPYVFKLYDSTATGQHRTNKNGFNLLLNPRIMLLLGLVASALALVLANGRPAVLGGTAPGVAPVNAAGSASGGANPASPIPARGPAAGGDGGPQSGQQDAAELKPFEGPGVFIVMSARFGAVWKYVVSFAGTQFTTGQILDMGYQVSTLGSCGVRLTKGDWSRVITCGEPPKEKEPAPQQNQFVLSPYQGGVPQSAAVPASPSFAPPPIKIPLSLS